MVKSEYKVNVQWMQSVRKVQNWLSLIFIDDTVVYGPPASTFFSKLQQLFLEYFRPVKIFFNNEYK